jgi:hypothetical protein
MALFGERAVVVLVDVRAWAAVANAGTAAVTNAVVASAVVLLPAVCVTPVVPVGKEGVPEKAGDARGAKPEMLAPAGIVTVPVKVGLSKAARVVSVPWT